MKKLLLIPVILFLISLSADPASGRESGNRLCELIATISVKNNGTMDLSPYNVSLTYPSLSFQQQELISIEYEYPEKYTIRTHKNGVDKYLFIPVSVPAGGSVVRKIKFRLNLRHYDFRTDRTPPVPAGDMSGFIEPSLDVESNDPEVIAIAREIMKRFPDAERRAQEAYVYPQRNFSFLPMNKAQGARWAMTNKTGDCTEYAAVFTAISRAMGIPARLTSEFNFKKTRILAKPNHNAAEVFLNGRWIPADPNLGLVPELGYGFGTASVNKVILKRYESWVWSTPSSAGKASSGYLKENVKADLSWEIITPEG